jgi:cyclase
MRISPKVSPGISITGRSLALFAGLSLLGLSAHAQGQTDYSSVQVKATKLADNFYVLDGAGGAIGILTGPDGVFMVDSQFAPLTGKIVAAIRQITDKPIRFMVNTHVHPDHTGGNENFAKMGVVIISREQLRDRLAHPRPGANGAPGTPAPAAALPLLTYTGRLNFHFDGDEVELVAIPPAHTDGDTMVRFQVADVIMTGDFYRSVQFPNIDRANGGSLNGMIEGLGMIVGMAGPNTKIVPGHGAVVDRNAVIAHRDMILVVRDRVAKLVAQGKSQDEVIAAKPASDYTGKIKEVAMTEDRFIGQVYAELKDLK